MARSRGRGRRADGVGAGGAGGRETRGRRGRMGFLSFVVASAFGLAIFSQANAQVFNRKAIIDHAMDAGRYERERTEPARRGTILSRDGRILAQSVDVYELGLIYDRLPRSPGFFADLAQASGLSIDELSRPSLTGASRRTWTSPLSADRAQDVRSVMKRWRADGISLERVMRRAYPLVEGGSALVGTVRDGRAILGLERGMDEVLSGRDGSAKGFVDRTGVFMPIKGSDIVERTNGQDLVLTVDSELQAEASTVLRATVEAHQATAGAVVALDPATGDILAMASWPSFDPYGPILAGQDTSAATMRRFPPGSTWKILTLAKALDEGKIGVDDEMECPGHIVVSRTKTIRCAHGAHGLIDWEKAIAESCNVAATRWAFEIGQPKMEELIRASGLLDRPDLGLPGVVRGKYVRDRWAERTQLANNGFGQAMDATPLALASAFGVFGNGGVRMEPRLVKQIGDEVLAPRRAGRVVSAGTAEAVRRMMVATIERDFGTGKGLRIPGYTLAGKTGTAQKISEGKVSGHVASFVGLVPAENPRAVVMVMIDEPRSGVIYGGAVAGPVFSQVAKALIRRLGIAPDSAGRGTVGGGFRDGVGAGGGR